MYLGIAMANQIPTTMFAWRKHKGSQVPVWEEVPVPKASGTNILVKMLASGVCRSDISLLTVEKQAPWFQEKYTLGHEGCGQIMQFGAEVGETSLKLGDTVALHAVPGCRRLSCSECSRGLSQICEDGHHSGIGQDGFYAPYATIDIKGAVLVPQGVSPAKAAVATDAVTTAYHGIVRRAEVAKQDTVFLFGLGGLGMNALQIIRNIGARVVVSDTRQPCLDKAAFLGVPPDDIVPLNVQPLAFVEKNGLSNAIDIVLDFVGKHQTFQDAQHIVRRGGKILCIGSLDPENTIQMKLGTRKRLSFIFSYGGQVQDLCEVLRMIASQQINPQVAQRPYGDLPMALEALKRGEVEARVVLTY